MRHFSVNDTILVFRQDEEKGSYFNNNYSHYALYREILDFLGSIGFYISENKEIKKKYPILNEDRNQGRYANLEFKSERYPAGFKFEFYQNIVFENPHGGYYDSEKLQKMPYLTRKQFELTIKKLKAFLIDKGIVDATEPTYKYAVAKIKYNYVKSWHHPQKDMNFFLSDLNGTTCESYNNKDRDGKIIYNGDVKYFRGYNGYLYRGRVYHNINNMWWVIVNKTGYRNVACFELFDLSPEDRKGRLKQHTPPKSLINKRNELSSASNKELIRELRRRGVIKKGKFI